MTGLTVLKLGGELLEDRDTIRSAAGAIVRLAAREQVVVVHGGGRAIDAELRRRGLEPRFVDGLRVTDDAALDVVVSVLAGLANTRLVAAVGAAGGRAIGLTGADGVLGLCERMVPGRSAGGAPIDLGLVGTPVASDSRLISGLLSAGYVPVVCSIGVDREGALLNVNADTLSSHLAVALAADALIVAGTTTGVLDGEGNRIDRLSVEAIASMTASGAAHSGMIAKLAACRDAVFGGVGRVVVVNGRGAADFGLAAGTRILLGSLADTAAEMNA